MKGKNKLRATFAMILLLISVFTVVQLTVPVIASPADVKVWFPSINWTYPELGADIGEEVLFDLRITNDTSPGENVSSWEADFSYDPDVLNITGITEGSFLKKSGTTTFTSGSINYVAGTITGVNCTLTTGSSNSSDLPPGVLVYLRFKVINFGSSAISITRCDAKDELGSALTVTTVDGSFEMRMKVEFPSISEVYPIYDIGDEVTFDLKIESPPLDSWRGGVISWEANFSYDPDVLNITAITEGSFLKFPGKPTTFNSGSINYVAGTITGVRCNYTVADSYNATGIGKLVYLRFKVINFGSSAISITGCTVTVKGDHAIPVVTVDGSFEMGMIVSFPSISGSYPAYDIGDTVTFDLKIGSPPLDSWRGGVISWKANFSYDPEVLNISTITEGSFLKFPTKPTTFNPGTIDYGNGTITGMACNYTVADSYNATGIGKLVYLTFDIVGAGISAIEITGCTVTVKGDHEIPLTLVDGYFALGARAQLPSIELDYPTYDIGYEFDMDLTIKTAELSSWQTGLKFDPDVLNVKSVTGGVGFYLNSSGPIQWIYDPSYINNTAGTVSPFGCALLGNTSAPSTGPAGEVVATIRFNVTGMGKTDIELVDFDALEVEQHHLLPLTLVDGYFELAAVLELGSSVLWTYPTHNIGEEFDMDLTIKTYELYSWQTGLSFDPTVVNVKSVTGGVGFYLNSSGPIQWIYDPSYINNTAGEVLPFSCTLLGAISAPATGPGGAVIATIRFNVTGAGNTTIELTDAMAFSSEIPVITVDGYFTLGAEIELTQDIGSVMGTKPLYWVWKEHLGTYPFLLTIGDEFCMNLTIRTAELYSWQTGLSFDPTVVNVINITGGLGFYLNSSGPIQWIYDPSYINNTAGEVLPFSCTLLGAISAPATGPGGAVIATIWFNVTGVGSEAMNLTDVKLIASELTLFGYLRGDLLVWGDINRDGRISIADVKIMENMYGEIPGFVNDPYGDVSNDGRISIADSKIEENLYSGVYGFP